jgi:hypothetical protein
VNAKLRSVWAKARALPRRRSVAIAGPLGVVLVAGVAVVLLMLLNDDDQSSSTSEGEAVATSSTRLRVLARAVGHPVYWAGERAGYTYELTRTADGSTYVRYLPSGVRLGDRRAKFLAIGTYVRPHAIATVRKTARRKGAFSKKLRAGGLAASSRSKPETVYFAGRDSNLLVEVYDPSPTRARRLVTSGGLDLVR